MSGRWIPWREIDLPTAALLALLAFGWLGSFGASVAPRLWLERGHLKHGFAVFAATQFVPFMYTAENRRALTFAGAPAADVADMCGKTLDTPHNHVAVGALLMPQHRGALALCSNETEVEVRSTWRTTTVSSRWRVVRHGQGYVVSPL